MCENRRRGTLCLEGGQMGYITRGGFHSRRLRLIYKTCSVFWSLGRHDKFSRIWTSLYLWLWGTPREVSLCNSCITETRFSVSKRLLRSCSNAHNTSFPDKSTSRVSLEMFSFSLMRDTLFVITSFVSGISASFLLKHLLMLIVVWCSASITRQSKLRLL